MITTHGSAATLRSALPFGLRARIVTGLLAIALLVVAVGTIGIFLHRRVGLQGNQVSQHTGPILLSIERMITEALRIQDEALGGALLRHQAGSSAGDLEQALGEMDEIQAAHDRFHRALESHDRLAFVGGDPASPLHDGIESAFRRYYAAAIDLTDPTDLAGLTERKRLLEIEEANLLGLLHRLFDIESNRLIASQERLAADADRVVLANLAVILIALGFALVIALHLIRAITAPLNRLQAAARSIGRGEYLSAGDNPLTTIDTADEIGILARAIEHMSSDLENLTEHLQYTADHDILTGLANRKLLLERLERVLDDDRRTGRSAVLMFIDLDRFKAVNDFHGHAAGDELLIATAERLRSCVREHDLVARLGGDEFVVLLAHVGEQMDTDELTRRLLTSLEEPYLLPESEVEVRLSASVGVMEIDDTLDSTADILRDADLAMYKAKTSGSGRIERFTKELRATALTGMQLESDLRQALAGGGLSVHYQPIITVQGGAPIGVEALARWNHPDLGYIPPDRFIAIAERSGVILDLDRFILRQACGQVADWNRRLGTELSVSVNLSGKQFASPSLIDSVRTILDESGLQPRLLHLEITETILMQRSEQTLAVFHRLKDLGIALHMDDFGTGYSSLAYLQRFDVDALKIDRSFIDQMFESEQSGVLVSTILAMAKALRLQVVAEGVETEEQRRHLLQLGCEFAQGYLFARPLPAEEMPFLLESHLRGQPGSEAAATGRRV